MDLHQRRRLVLGSAAWLLSSCAGAAPRKRAAAKPAADVDDGAPDAVPYGTRDDVARFADAVAERRGLDAEWLRSVLAQARFQPLVVRYIMPSATGAAKNWNAYRARFVEPIRIRAGVAFWRGNERWLAQAEEMYGVPPEVVVGIVGVESIYGRQMGNFRIIDALATLAFDFPAGRSDRSSFFQDELESWFVLCKSEGVDPLSWRGSYAGAIGMAQFMPSSFNRFAVDFDGDGHVDLHTSAADVIGSVANYLAEFGWKRGLAARFDVEPPGETRDRALLLAPDIVPSFTAAEMVERGARLPDAAFAVESLLALVELQNGDAAPTYVAGTTNFYTLTRYNWSSYYAMAVLALGEAVRPAAAR
jgi:membrane-bound lytic murein transglycosylase B